MNWWMVDGGCIDCQMEWYQSGIRWSSMQSAVCHCGRNISHLTRHTHPTHLTHLTYSIPL